MLKVQGECANVLSQTKSVYPFPDADLNKRVCDGTKDIKRLENPYTETSQLRATNMVYKAVYAIAHAIHNAVCEERNASVRCDKQASLEPKQVSLSEKGDLEAFF